jgi:protein-tyrosine phosphatase
MGNICRSPSAEGFFVKALECSPSTGLISCDSAGTHGYHVGETPDPRAVQAAAEFDVEISHLRARKVGVEDFYTFDIIVAMDEANMAILQSLQPADSKASLDLMMSFHPERQPGEVPDPYYGGMEGFTYMCELLEAATVGLLEAAEDRLN